MTPEDPGTRSVPYRPGMEVDGVTFTRPEVRPGPVEWEPYVPPRFSRSTRVAISVALLVLPALLVFSALVQVVLGEGRVRAAFVLLLMPLVPATPLLIRAMRDLWGSQT